MKQMRKISFKTDILPNVGYKAWDHIKNIKSTHDKQILIIN